MPVVTRLTGVRCTRVCTCVRRWCSSQLEKESGKGAISAQLALIASTLFWWVAVLCEMTKCCIPGLLLWPHPPLLVLEGRQPQPGGTGEQASETANISTVVITLFSSAHSVDLFPASSLCLCCCSCSIFA